jgi:hypothetical protein
MTVPVVSAIIVHGITGEQPVHYRGDRNGAGYQQQVEVLCEVPDYVNSKAALALMTFI